jgi:hypothetical protein
MSDTNGRADAPVDEDAPLFDDAPIPSYPMTTITIAAVSPEGYPITIALNDPAQGAMTNWIKLLASKSFTPPAANPTQAATAPQANGEAVCPYHGPMKESTIKGKEGTYYCPKKMADGSYCKEKYPK